MDVSVLAVAQLNRDAVQMERPTSANMADSYDLARSADVVTILSGDLESEQISLWLDKSRHGTSGVLIPLTFDRPTQTFRESHKGEHRPVFAIDT
jgi:replicative DNA helicase